MTKCDKNGVGVAILVGGHSSRMGKAKENLPIVVDGQKRTFLEHLSDMFSDFSFRYVSVNAGQVIRLPGVRTIKDLREDVGPMGGIYSVLKSCECEAVLCIACDMPKVSLDMASKLIESWDGAKACVPMVDGKREPLFGIYTSECIPYIETLIKNCTYKLGALLDAVDAQFVDFSSDSDKFENVNTPEEYGNLKI